MKDKIRMSDRQWSANLWSRVKALFGGLDTRVTALEQGGGGGGAVSGVKGDAESTYRTGNVNLTAANIGAKATQSAVSDPTASGTGLTFIDSISQDAQGVIMPTKKTVQTATQSADGVMSSTDKAKLDGIAAGAQVNTITGVKGNAENSYRTGNVNLTPANIGAVAFSDILDSLTSTATDKALSAGKGKELNEKIQEVQTTKSLGSFSTLAGLSTLLDNELSDMGISAVRAICVNVDQATSVGPFYKGTYYRGILFKSATSTNYSSFILNAMGNVNAVMCCRTLNDGWNYYKIIDDSDVIDSLSSTETTRPLSANQGKVLNEAITQSTAFHVGDTFKFDGAQVPFRNLADKSALYFAVNLPKRIGDNITSFNIEITYSSNTWYTGSTASSLSIGQITSSSTIANKAIGTNRTSIRFSATTTQTPVANAGIGVCELYATITFT